MKFILVALAASMVARSAAAEGVPSPCLFEYKPGLIGTPHFEDYPAKISVTKPTQPKLVGDDARTFRTMIRKGSATGVNFAGHFTIVGWGCGSSCLDWAVVDRITGSVYFDPSFRIVATDHVSDNETVDNDLDQTFNALRFRRDSSLLIVQGAPNEEMKREGIHFLRWTGRWFVRLAYQPTPDVCHE
jgi:hypothetical protein